jgi:hypothetical protein
MRRVPFLLALALLGAAAVPRPAAAEPCTEGRISEIFIDNRSIFDTTDPDLDPRLGWGYRLANALHYRTRRSVIRRELLFRPGDCFDAALLEESERLLRDTDYISRVDIFGIRQDDGSMHVIVDTRDEWSTKVDLRLRFQNGIQMEGIRVRETNLLGTGQTVGFFHESHRVERIYGVLYHTPQLAGTRWDLRAASARTLAGTAFRQSLTYPFTGEVGRWSAVHGFRRDDRYFDYLAGGGGGEYSVLLPLRDKGMELAVLTRFGRPGRYTVFGGGVAFQDIGFPDGAAGVRVIRSGGFDDAVGPDSATVGVLRSQLHEVGSIRPLLVVGQRNVSWVKRRGLDTMRGEQDVPLGGEVNLTVGRSLRALERDNDLSASLALAAAVEAGRLLAAGRARGDGRRNLDAHFDDPEWQDLYAEAELLSYFRLPGQTFLLRVAAAGGWHTRTPFQLTLGGDRGLRGYPVERFPGGRRLVLTFEDRFFLGWPWPYLLDLGVTGFADAGRIWPGDAPFGEDSGWRASVGAGLRASFPPGGRNTYRLDLAVPVARGFSLRQLRFTLSLQEVVGLIVPPGDPQLQRSRPPGIVDGERGFPN